MKNLNLDLMPVAGPNIDEMFRQRERRVSQLRACIQRNTVAAGFLREEMLQMKPGPELSEAKRALVRHDLAILEARRALLIEQHNRAMRDIEQQTEELKTLLPLL